MSGGSYNYAFDHVLRFAECLETGVDYDGTHRQIGVNRALRLAFAAHLRRTAAAMQAIEWVDSYDSSPPEDEKAIKIAIFGEVP